MHTGNNSTKSDASRHFMETVHELRRTYQGMIRLTGTGDAVRKVETITMHAENPAREIPLRLYYPAQTSQADGLPIFLLIHGGGFVCGNFDTHDVLARAVANGAGCIVVAVEYRLAPEHPFPAGLEDVYAVLLWIKNSAAHIGADAAKTVIGGDSAGGNLAAALALLARDRNGPKVSGQWLMYPTVSNAMDTESWAQLGDICFPTRQLNRDIIAAYIPQGTRHDDPLAAPLWGDLEHLPPALIQVGGCDPLNGECKQYADKLEKSGVKADFFLYPALAHGFLQFYQDEKNFPNARPTLEQGLRWLRDTFAAA